MVQLSKKFRKNLATDLRTKGLSYSEITERISVPKSTLSHWFKNLALTENQLQKLKERQIRAGKINLQKKLLKTSRAIEEIKNFSAKDIQKISKRELWLIGIMLYWRESKSEANLQRGIRLASSDPSLIKLFLKWLQGVGNIEDKEIGFDIFIDDNKKGLIDECVSYWSKITHFPKNDFSHIYFHKNRINKNKRKVLEKSQFGLLRIRVKASSMLARQMAGWTTGIKEALSL